MTMSDPKVVRWHPMYHAVGHALLAEAGADVVMVDSNDVGEAKQALHGARVLWVRTPERVTADVLDAWQGSHRGVVLSIWHRQHRHYGCQRSWHPCL